MPIRRYRSPGPWRARGLTRRSFVTRAAWLAGAAAAGSVWSGPALAKSAGRPARSARGLHDLAVVRGEDPAANVRKALEAMGGLGRFVKRGATVVVKPNMAWDRTPEQAGNTNPLVMAEVVRLCLAAGARRVNVFDRPCNEVRRCYARSGIKAAVEAAGGTVYEVDEWNAVAAAFPFESPMKDWPLFKDALACDALINVPVMKHHDYTGVTLSMKNFMGVCLGDRGKIHDGIGRRLADLAHFLQPDLTIIDAYRVLTAHGPSGGDLADVALRKTVIVGTDPVLADAYGAEFFGLKPRAVPYIAAAIERRYGSADLKAADIRFLRG